MRLIDAEVLMERLISEIDRLRYEEGWSEHAVAPMRLCVGILNQAPTIGCETCTWNPKWCKSSPCKLCLGSDMYEPKERK